MDKKRITIKYDKELLGKYVYEGDIGGQSFETLSNQSFQIKRFNLINERVYDTNRINKEIIEYIILYWEEYNRVHFT